MIEVASQSIIYIFCPALSATGGPEALHQLAFHLRGLGFNAYIYYFNNTYIDPVNPVYKIYNVPYVKEVENNHTHFIILPETYLEPIFDKALAKVSKIIWWLSVTNYNIVLEELRAKAAKKNFYFLKSIIKPRKYPPLPTLERLKRYQIHHIAHSYFSKDFLLRNGISISGRISDYMNKVFLTSAASNTEKQDFIIYNPKKNGLFLEKIKSRSSDLNWKPLENLSPEEVSLWMQKSKIYIDFGYHPGKERMPREACIMDCCLIIGREGSASFKEDMPILEKYIFDKDDDNIDNIILLLRDCLKNYELAILDFKEYKKALYLEEAEFKKDIKNTFITKAHYPVQSLVTN